MLCSVWIWSAVEFSQPFLGRSPARPDRRQPLARGLDFQIGVLELGAQGVATRGFCMDRSANRLDPAANLLELGFLWRRRRLPPTAWLATKRAPRHSTAARANLKHAYFQHSQRPAAAGQNARVGEDAAVILRALFWTRPGGQNEHSAAGDRRCAAMNRLIEYTTTHPFLVIAAAILAVLAIVIEIRHRARGASRDHAE